MYVVVWVGETVTQSCALTVPIPGEIDTVVAFSTCQQSWEDPPALMVAGFSENCRILAVWPLVTVTVTGEVTVLPSGPTAVSVYVVVCVGDTTRLPFGARLSPTPLMFTLVAPEVVHDSVEDSPEMMLVGFASNRMICGFETTADTVTVTVAVCCLPPLPAAVRV